jgi:hypothetical protein
MGVLLRIVTGFWNEPAMIRRWGTPSGLNQPAPEGDSDFRDRVKDRAVQRLKLIAEH